jgi:hypothetical protein
MKKLMEEYCRQCGIEQTMVRFLYEGVRINYESTPESLEMDKEEDKEVFLF